MIIDTGLDGLDILFGPALSFCPFFAPSLRAHEILLALGFPIFVKPMTVDRLWRMPDLPF